MFDAGARCAPAPRGASRSAGQGSDLMEGDGMVRSPDFKTRPRSYYLSAVLILVVGVVIGLVLSAGFDLPRAPRAERGTLSATASSGDLPESPFVGLVERALPAVVFVDVRKKA